MWMIPTPNLQKPTNIRHHIWYMENVLNCPAIKDEIPLIHQIGWRLGNIQVENEIRILVVRSIQRFAFRKSQCLEKIFIGNIVELGFTLFPREHSVCMPNQALSVI